jgi:hypothetical protein
MSTMELVVDTTTDKKYDTDVHPEVTKIVFPWWENKRPVGDFFEEDRFPNLLTIVCEFNETVNLIINCSSLQKLQYSSFKPSTLRLFCPSLEKLSLFDNKLTELELDCFSLKELSCSFTQITKLKLNCPSLIRLSCHRSQLTSLELNCPALREFSSYMDRMNNLNGMEFCKRLQILKCSRTLENSVNILKQFLPDIVVEYH